MYVLSTVKEGFRLPIIKWQAAYSRSFFPLLKPERNKLLSNSTVLFANQEEAAYIVT